MKEQRTTLKFKPVCSIILFCSNIFIAFKPGVFGIIPVIFFSGKIYNIYISFYSFASIIYFIIMWMSQDICG